MFRCIEQVRGGMHKGDECCRVGWRERLELFRHGLCSQSQRNIISIDKLSRCKNVHDARCVGKGSLIEAHNDIDLVSDKGLYFLYTGKGKECCAWSHTPIRIRIVNR